MIDRLPIGMPEITSYSDGTFTTPRRSGPKRYVFPFRDQGNYLTKLVEQDYKVLAGNYASSGVAPLDSPCPFEAGAFLLEQSDPRHLDPGLVEFTRTYGTTPPSRVEMESWVYTPPTTWATWTFFRTQISGNHADGSPTSISAIMAAIPSGSVFVSARATQIGLTTVAPVVTLIEYKRLYNSQTGEFIATDQQGAIRSHAVASHVQFDYFHTSSMDSIPLFNAEATFTDGTSTGVTGKVAEPSTLKRWKGNVWERATRVIPATT